MFSSEAWKDSEGQAKEVIAEMEADLRMDGIQEVMKRTTSVNLVCHTEYIMPQEEVDTRLSCCEDAATPTALVPLLKRRAVKQKKSYLLRAISTNKVIRGLGVPLGVLFQRTPAAAGPITQVIYSSHLLIWQVSFLPVYMLRTAKTPDVTRQNNEGVRY